jgi:hypothetical protein
LRVRSGIISQQAAARVPGATLALTIALLLCACGGSESRSPTVDEAGTAKVESELAENFGGAFATDASKSIEDLTVYEDGSVTVVASLADTAANAEVASEICEIVRGTSEADPAINSVTVQGTDGEGIRDC